MKKPFATYLGVSSGKSEKNFFEVFNVSEKEKKEFDFLFKKIKYLKMKKLLLTIVIPLSMVCCQSENNEKELTETHKIEEVKKEVNCLIATVVYGKPTVIEDYWNNIEGIDGYKVPISMTTQFHYYCFDKSEYTFDQMKNIVKSYYD